MLRVLAHVSDDALVLRYLLAPVAAEAAGSLGLQRTVAARDGVALTFDDGPHPEGTRQVLEILAAAGAQASFFLVGEQVQRRPRMAAEIACAGHAVAVHGYRHRLQVRLSAREVAADLARAREVIADAAGVEPAWHRPPYGVYSPAGLAAAREAGLKPLLWSRWGKDWRKFTTAERIAARVTEGLSAGDVILLHDADFYSAKDSHRRTVAALRIVLAELARREIGTVLPI
ncbi:MAG: polysaccharide deacetylase family protein [Solirubrobacterales bacterium]|nr:polysaccharide deacetylase family protein [Solirubrobacterales bacterium]